MANEGLLSLWGSHTKHVIILVVPVTRRCEHPKVYLGMLSLSSPKSKNTLTDTFHGILIGEHDGILMSWLMK